MHLSPIVVHLATGKTYEYMPSSQERYNILQKSPGSASLYFKHILETVLEDIFGWRKDGKGPTTYQGIFPLVEAFCYAVESDGSRSLHCHMLVWLLGGCDTFEKFNDYSRCKEHRAPCFSPLSEFSKKKERQILSAKDVLEAEKNLADLPPRYVVEKFLLPLKTFRDPLADYVEEKFLLPLRTFRDPLAAALGTSVPSLRELFSALSLKTLGDYLAESPPTFVPSIRKLPDNILHFPTEDKYEEKFSTARKLELERLGVCEDCYSGFLFFTQSFMKFLKTEFEAEPFFLPEIHDVVCKCTINKCGGNLFYSTPKL